MPATYHDRMPDRGQLARIRLICCDLDETLLGPDHQIGARSRQAIAALQQRGTIVAICTGRAPATTIPIVTDLRTRYYICNNGATVHDGMVLLTETVVPAALVAEMATFFDGHGCPTFLHTAAGYLVTRMSTAIEEASAVRGVWPTIIPAAGWAVAAHKVMPFGAAHLYETALGQWGDRAQIVCHPDYLEIAPHGVNKAGGARVLARHLSLKAAEVAAIGNATNDIELLTWAGVGVAVANAMPEARAAADWIVSDYSLDGAADLLEAVLTAIGD